MLRFILSIAVLGTLFCSKDAPVSPPSAGKATADDIASDRAVLEVLYKATDGDNWKDNTNWLSENPLASWHGVGTDSKGRVDGLWLQDNNLTGYLPSELGQLTKLEILNLAVNELTSSILPELGQLTNLLSLEVSHNQLTGSILPELGQLTKLGSLALAGNGLTGSIPPELGQLTNLRRLRLSGNQLTGSIPPELGQLTKLENLALSSNQLTGSIPPELGQLTNLLYLNLGHNQLTGSIPPELGQLTKLIRLDLGYNQLTGSIPPELGQLTNLIQLRLLYNGLTGSIPPELGQLTKLEHLALRENKWAGCIPNALQNLPFSDRFQSSDFDQLGILFCGKEDDQLDRAALIALYNATGGDNWKNKTNWLTDAPLDRWHGVDVDAFGRVIAIDLIGNGLQGAIPPEIKELTALKELKLGHNQLTDVTEIGNLTSLIVLMLHYNQLGGEQLPGDDQISFASLFDAFQGNNEEPSPSGSGSGSIPPTFAQLTNLKLLWLQGNQIADISSLGNLTTSSGISITLSYNQIVDISPLENLTNLVGLWLKDNQITDISPLENLTNLRGIVLSNNQITDISPLENLDSLRSIGLSYNQITDISPLENLTNLRGIGLTNNQIVDISPLENLINLESLGLSNNQITDISPLLNLMALEELDLWGNPLDSGLQTIRTLEERGVLVFFQSIVEGIFNIELVYLEDFSDSQKRRIGSAAQRWASILTADLPDYEFTSDWQASCGNQSFEIRKGERIDDLRIYVGFIEPGDWATARGGPSLLRDNHLPVVGCMSFEPIDIFYDVYFTGLHEVGHVLGFGTTWTNNGLLQESSWDFPNGDPHFNGPLAVVAFDEAGGDVYTGAKVPVAGFVPNGEHDNSHWRHSVFGDELMTVEGGGKRMLSAITLQSLADLGYSVDLSQADAYTLSAPRAAKPVETQDRQPFCDVSGLPEPVYVSEIE